MKWKLLYHRIFSLRKLILRSIPCGRVKGVMLYLSSYKAFHITKSSLNYFNNKIFLVEDLLAWNDLSESWFGIPMKVTSKTHFKQIWPFFLDIRWYLICFDCLLGAKHQVKPFTHINSILWKHLWDRNCTSPPTPFCRGKNWGTGRLGALPWVMDSGVGKPRRATAVRLWSPDSGPHITLPFAITVSACQCEQAFLEALQKQLHHQVWRSQMSTWRMKKKKTWLRIKCSVASRYKWLYHKTT